MPDNSVGKEPLHIIHLPARIIDHFGPQRLTAREATHLYEAMIERN